MRTNCKFASSAVCNAYALLIASGAFYEATANKRRRISITIPKTPVATFNWVSKYNLEGKVIKSSTELGDGASSRVFQGTWNGTLFAIKQLKIYVPRLAPSFVEAYKPLFNLSHPNIAQVHGICPQPVLIILEYCSKSVNGFTVTTLAGLLLHLGNGIPMELRLLALIDTAEGVQYLHHKNIVHGDIKLQNILVCGATEDNFVFKTTDYACNMISGASHLSSKSASFKQLMTPGYLAPELIGDVNLSMQPTIKSDVYSLAIFIYEIFCCKEPWPVASMQLLSAIQSGHQPAIPDSAPQCIAQLIQKYWRMKPLERPNISEISQQLEGHLEVITSDKENDLSNQDAPAKHTDECFAVPSTSSSVSSSVIDDNRNSPEKGLANQDAPAKRTDKCFAVPSTSLSVNSSVIDDNVTVQKKV